MALFFEEFDVHEGLVFFSQVIFSIFYDQLLVYPFTIINVQDHFDRSYTHHIEVTLPSKLDVDFIYSVS